MKLILIFIISIFFSACQKEVVYIEKLEGKNGVVENETVTETFSKKYNIRVTKKEDTNSLFGIAHNHFRRD